MNDKIKLRLCRCSHWNDDDILPMTHEDYPDAVLAEFDVIKRRTPWLDIVKCKTCHSYWYIAIDTVDDDFYLMRLSAATVQTILEENVWPDKFDNKYALWPDDDWLKAFGYFSLQDWQEKNNSQ